MYKIIAIERESASGGNEIGEKLAKKLGYQFFNQNILVESAKHLGIAPSYIGELEETAPGSVIFNLSNTVLSGSNYKKNLPLSEQLFLMEKQIMEEKVQEGNCVIIGRCASQIFADHPDCLKVFIHANQEYRIKRAIEKEGINPTTAEQVLKKIDKRRRDFYTTHTGKEWGASENFEVCLDSSVLSIDTCIQMLEAAARSM